MTKYDIDFHAWAAEQAEALKRRSSNELDWDHIAEELAELGRSRARELKSRFVVLLTHLLEWQHQPAFRSRSWSQTITVQRKDIEDHLAENPSLGSIEQEQFEAAYRAARLQASSETGLGVTSFPNTPPFDLGQVKSEAWWPAGPAEE